LKGDAWTDVAIYKAVKIGNKEVISILLDHGAVAYHPRCNLSCTVFAAQNRALDILEILISHPLYSAKSDEAWELWEIAIGRVGREMMDLLVKANVKFSGPDFERFKAWLGRNYTAYGDAINYALPFFELDVADLSFNFEVRQNRSESIE
jgi:hypothetical protein